jgi:hypothetical protein
MTGAAHLWYTHVTKATPFFEWDTFVRDLTHDTSPPLSHGTLGDLAPLRYDDALNYHIDTFAAYMLDVGITSTLHRINIIDKVPTYNELADNTISTWLVFQREDALIEEGGSSATRPMGAQGPIGIGRTSNSDTREAAIAKGAAAPAWSMDQGLIFFNGHLYIPVVPFILANMLQVLLHAGPRHMEPLALSSHLSSSTTHDIGVPTNILLGRSTVSTTTAVFINNLGRQPIHVGNVYIAPCADCDLHHLPPNKFGGGHFMFGTMLDLTTTPPFHPSATTRLRIPAYIISNITISINRPPRMQCEDALRGKGVVMSHA